MVPGTRGGERVLGAVTIGQSPRPDLIDGLRGLLPDSVRVVQAGALDDLADEQIGALRPRDARGVLTTALRDGRAVEVDCGSLVSLVETAIAKVEAAGSGVTLLMCTGRFPPLAHVAPMVHAHTLLASGVAGLASAMSRVGVIAPLPDQLPELAAQWGQVLSARVDTAAADPYSETCVTRVAHAARLLAGRGAELLVLDCMGFDEAARGAAAASGIPAVLSRTIVGRLTAEFVAAVPGGSIVPPARG